MAQDGRVMPLDQAEKEDLRFALRRYLASRPSAAVSLDMMQHHLRVKGIEAAETDIRDELTYWEGLTPPQVKRIRVPHSAAKAWQITSEGLLAEQRGD